VEDYVRIAFKLLATASLGALLLFPEALLARDQAPKENDSAALLDTQSYLRLLGPASEFAAQILAGLGNPVITPDKTVALQAITTQPVSATVLFPTAKQFPQYLPLLRSSTHSFCQIVPPAPPENVKNLIICDPDTLRQLDILIRVAHSPAYPDEMKNDWTYMGLLHRIQTEPAKVLAEAKPSVTDEHMQEHMSFILVFLLAHETWHLTHGAGTQFNSESDPVQSPKTTEFNQKLMCRNYEAFPREGLSLFVNDHPTPLAEEGTTEDPSFRASLKQTRQIWQEEEDADHFGADTLSKLVAFIKEKAPTTDLVHMSSEIIQNFGNMMLDIWLSKMQPFAYGHCGGFSDQDFYLTRCMCQDKTIYNQATNLFGPTHPPIVLRMHTAAFYFAAQVKKNAGVDLLHPKEPDAFVALRWLEVIDGLSDVPLKLSMASCLDLPKQLTEGGNIIQVLPDLAGFVGAQSSTQHPGYPADESKFMQACLATKPANPTLTKTPSSATNNPEPASDDKLQADILATRKGGTKLPTVEARDCAFRMAGITSELSSMDQLDKDLLYIRAGYDLPSEFAEKYASQISDDKRTKLQILIKSGVSCSQP
jgi:hypothetical protein